MKGDGNGNHTCMDSALKLPQPYVEGLVICLHAEESDSFSTRTEILYKSSEISV